MLFLTSFALALRFFHLSAVSLRGDEAFSALFSAGSLLDQIRQLRTIEPHPPAYYALLHLVLRLAGDSELAVRFPSVAFGTLLVPLSYAAARRALGVGVALPTALLVAVNPFLVWHSQDARSYTLIPALGLAAAYFAARILGSAGSGRDRFARLGLGVSQGLLLLTHYAGAYFVLSLNAVAVALALRDQTRPRLAALHRGRPGAWLRAQALTALVALPWWLFAREIILTRQIDWLVQLGPLAQVRQTFAAYSLGPIDVGGAQAWLLVPFAIGLLLGAISFGRSVAGRCALAALIVPLLVAFLMSLGRTSFVDRYFVFVVPVYAAILAAGVVALGRRSRALAALLLVGLVAASVYSLGLYFSDPKQAKAPDWRGAARAVVADFRSGDALLIDTADPALAFYAHREARRSAVGDAWIDETLPRASKKDEWASRLGSSLGERERIWLLPTGDTVLDPDGLSGSWLDAAALRLRSWRFGGLEARLYATPRSLLAARARPAPHAFALDSGARIELLGADLSVRADEAGVDSVRVHPGDSFWLTLYFRTTDGVAGDLRVFNHLLDAAGEPRGQHDGAPAEGTRPTNTWRAGEVILDRHRLTVDTSASAGEYRVRTGLYDPTTLKRLSILDEAGNPAADAVETVGIVVER